MSELTPCNYCSLRDIKARAKELGEVVTLVPGGIGTQVFVHQEGDDLRDWSSEDPCGSNQVSEMAEIGNVCEC